jgi:hypothetical protein
MKGARAEYCKSEARSAPETFILMYQHTRRHVPEAKHFQYKFSIYSVPKELSSFRVITEEP